jgi:hypothetical protein
MKKLIFGIVLAVAFLAGTVQAQNHVSQSFINATSLSVSNAMGITNLLSTYLAGSIGTNITGTLFTNLFGQRMIVATSASTTNVLIANQNLLKDVSLWGSTDGIPLPLTNSAVAVGLYNASIFIRVMGDTAHAGALTFYFTAVPDGENENTATVLTATATVSGATVVTSLTPLNMNQLIGCKSLRLRAITDADATRNNYATVLDCKLVGFRP